MEEKSYSDFPAYLEQKLIELVEKSEQKKSAKKDKDDVEINERPIEEQLNENDQHDVQSAEVKKRPSVDRSGNGGGDGELNEDTLLDENLSLAESIERFQKFLEHFDQKKIETQKRAGSIDPPARKRRRDIQSDRCVDLNDNEDSSIELNQFSAQNTDNIQDNNSADGKCVAFTIFIHNFPESLATSGSSLILERILPVCSNCTERSGSHYRRQTRNRNRNRNRNRRRSNRVHSRSKKCRRRNSHKKQK